MSATIQYRTATRDDIPGMQVVRNAVKENMLSDPALVKDADYIPFLESHGRGWVAIDAERIVGFAIADLEEENVWALFLLPEWEGHGIGTDLQKRMLDWYFTQKEFVWLGTAPGTRAERFYKAKGWTPSGMHGTKEVKFTMNREQWQALQQ
jgi:GNAT superfamily N-acetyltransferase